MNSITFKHIVRDRPIVFLWMFNLFIVVITLIAAAFHIKPSELNIPTRYTTFGTTHIYNDAWYYLIGFILFLIAATVLHALITVKLYDQKGALFARIFSTLTIMVSIIAIFQITAIIGVASLLQ